MAAGGVMGLVALARPRQWIKNAFVLAPLVFSGAFVHRGSVLLALATMMLFCVASSSAYVLNDLLDLEADRRHPAKRLSRPLAAGTVSRRTAVGLLIGLWTVLLAGFLILPGPTGVAVGYLVLTAAYSVWLKHVPVADLFALAAGFVLRVWAGAVAIGVALSAWMLTTTLSLALYLAAVKRREELRVHGEAARGVLAEYTVALLDRYADWAAAGAIVFYGLFVMTVRPQLAVSVPLVLFGLFRYAYVVEKGSGGESPTDVVWRDPVLLGTALVWGALCAAVLWPVG